ncbi:ankyrin repeat and SOCS box protein 1 isoform X1 [Rhineura floridana]|uniref:ankyrin repeat and SOCS box protein 1 isoform X1 n=1 Tax=Rhineura floridana TaxID=261503 RepID=UPI002AC864E6|nr:ankyrin repeat and SOCS box protein 1 isoform X1 [Rhineura floridana]
MADASNPDSQDAGTDVPEHEARESLAAQTPGNGHGIRLSAMSGNAGRNLKEWLKEQFCDHPIEHCADTRLHDAAYVGDLQTIRNLLEEESFQSRINEKSVWCCGWLPCTPLRIAATAGHGNCVDFLIQKGAEIDLVDVKGQTALYVAVMNGHRECAQILLQAGADPNGSRHHRSTPVYHAARVGRADILKQLIRYGADVDVNHHWTSGIPSPSSRPLTSLVVCPLYISAAYHNLPCFRLLLQAGANPDFNSCGPVNIQGFSRGSAVCVMDAVLRHGCDVAFVNLLIDFGANLNLVKWETLGEEATGRIKVNPEAMQVFKEARSCPRSLMSLCRVAVLRALGKCRLQLIHTLPVPDPIMKFLLYEQQDPQGTTEGVIYLIFIYLFIVFIYRPIARSSLGGLQQL